MIYAPLAYFRSKSGANALRLAEAGGFAFWILSFSLINLAFERYYGLDVSIGKILPFILSVIIGVLTCKLFKRIINRHITQII